MEKPERNQLKMTKNGTAEQKKGGQGFILRLLTVWATVPQNF